MLATTLGSNLEHIKFEGQTSTIMRVLTSRDGDLLSQFDNISEGNTNDDIDCTSLKSTLINNHVAGNKCRIKGQVPLEHIFGLCKTF